MRGQFESDDVNRMRVALGRIARRVDRQSTEGGMTRTQFSILSTIARRGPLGVGEVADIEGLNPTMLSRMIGKLSDAGLVTRSPAPGDKRVVSVAVTDEGRRLFQRLKRKRTALFTERLGELSPDHADALLRALPALEELADQMCSRRS